MDSKEKKKRREKQKGWEREHENSGGNHRMIL